MKSNAFFPHQKIFNLDPILNPVFEKWVKKLPDLRRSYQAYSDDFGVWIQSLLVSKEIQERQFDELQSQFANKRMWKGMDFWHTSKNFEEVTKLLGIDLIRSEKFYFVRDHFFRKPGLNLTAYLSPKLSEAIQRTHSSNLILDKTATTHTKNQLFNKWSGYSQMHAERTEAELKKLFLGPAKVCKYTYFEGGNVWHVTDSLGKLKVLIGEDHLMQTLLTLALENSPWENLAKEVGLSFDSLISEIDSKISGNDLTKVAEEAYSLGLLGEGGLIERKELLNILLIKFLNGPAPIYPFEKGWFRNMAMQLRVLKPLDPNDVEMQRKAVIEYLAKKKITCHLMAQDFGVAAQDLHCITQVNSHLDTFLRPGPNHTFFLVNYGFLAEILEKIYHSKEFTLLPKEDQEHLLRYLSSAKKMEQELGPLIKKAEEQIRKAGFLVLPIPGHFVYESKTMYQEFPMPSEGNTINFINSLTGWSEKTKRYFYIAHGLSVGQQLGSLLMDLFALFLEKYVPDLDVFFIGRDPDNPSDFGEALDAWNRLETQAGIHCHTFELKAQSHPESSD